MPPAVMLLEFDTPEYAVYKYQVRPLSFWYKNKRLPKWFVLSHKSNKQIGPFKTIAAAKEWAVEHH